MIQLFHVHKYYGAENPALIDINFEIKKGEFVFLSGASGAGKSTLLKLLFAAERPSRGQLLIQGKNVAKLRRSAIPYLRRNIGIVFQDFKLLPTLTVTENVAITLEVQNTPLRDQEPRVLKVLKQVGLAHRMKSRAATLSGGEQQRVAVARALINDPQIILADEPTGNLDAERSNEIIELLEQANLRGTTVLLATHDRELLGRKGRRVLRLDHGRLERR